MSEADKPRRIAVDRAICIGAENCRAYAPATFDIAADGKVAQTGPDIADAVTADAVVSGCPSGALAFEE
jgi:ferredoxin